MIEKQLIRALQQGHEPAFRQLVDTYKDRLYHTILGFIQNNDDAEDALQEVFIKVFKNIQSFREQSSLATWMYRIAATHCLDIIRRKKRMAKVTGFLSLFGENEYAGGHETELVHPGVLAENKEMAAYLFKAMQQLPGSQRTAFVLQKIEGLSQVQIAEVLNISVGAVESLLSRAKQNLKKLLTNLYHER